MAASERFGERFDEAEWVPQEALRWMANRLVDAEISPREWRELAVDLEKDAKRHRRNAATDPSRPRPNGSDAAADALIAIAKFARTVADEDEPF